MGDPVMNGSEGSLHLATCWTWPSSSIEIGRRPALRAMLSELYASGSPAASLLDVIVTHLLNKLCSQQQQSSKLREAGWGIKSFQRTKEPSY